MNPFGLPNFQIPITINGITNKVWYFYWAKIGQTLANQVALPAGSYTNTNLTVNANGVISAISNGSGGGGSGTVTSIDLTSTGGTLTITGTNPITTSGTINLEVTTPGGSGTVTSVAAGASGDIVIGGTPTVAPTVDLSAGARADLALAATALQSVSIATGNGLTGGPLAASGSTVAVDLTYAFTWTGLHAFTKTGEALKVVGDTSFLNFRNTAATSVLQLGTVKGVFGGTDVTDAALLSIAAMNFYANSAFEGSLNGGMTLGVPTGGPQGVGTLNVSGGLYINGVSQTSAAPSSYNTAYTALTVPWSDAPEDVWPQPMPSVYPGDFFQVNGVLSVTPGSGGSNYQSVQIANVGGTGTISVVGTNSTLAMNAPAGGSLNMLLGGTQVVVVNSSRQVVLPGCAGGVPSMTVAGGAAGASEGIQVSAGTSTSDYAIQCKNSTGVTTFFTVNGVGSLVAPKSPLVQTVTQAMTGLVGLRTTNNNITSSTALTADTSLQVTFNETGTYRLEGYLAFSEATLGTGGFQFDLGGGAATVSSILWSAYGFGTASVTAAATTSATTAQQFTAISTSSAAPSYAIIDGTVVISVAGTFGVRVAQVASSANTTTVQPNSHLIATKIG